ncbi:MAG: cytochrome c maturation protein CcmE [Anaerolineae bacterium]|nr:cytochrome c maturation protein CcmE [Anaerolineae bacterium]
MESTLRRPPVKSTTAARGNSIKFIAGGIVLLGVIAFVMFNTIQANTVYYYTLSEVQTQQASLVGKTIRVNGPLDKTSIRNDQKNLVLEFNLVQDGIVLPVVYQGVAPDTMSSGESVVAEGKLDSDGVFRAQSILVKCPSKYQESPVQY